MSSSGEIEAQDLFIKRMKGLTQLFASCASSLAVGGTQNTSVDMSYTWMFLSRTVNLQPRPATTATVLCSLLSVCGSRLIHVYGRQAQKMFRFLLNQFLPVIRDITDVESGDGGAMERLEQCLKDLLTKQHRDPEGFLKRSFWYGS